LLLLLLLLLVVVVVAVLRPIHVLRVGRRRER
jgi:hypothetical protein